jgi:hypothetical protein
VSSIQFLRDIVEGMGGKLEVFRFDCGLTIAVTLAPGIAYRDSAECGEENALFNRVHGWLDQQPWPTEDDPRVEGAY